MTRGIRIAVVAAVAAVAVAGTPPARADAYKDEKLGYSFQVPARWDTVPVDAGDWLVAKFQSNREYEVTNSRNWSRHRPWLEVVCIPFAAKEDRGATVETTEKGVKVTRSAPWKDLKEYMDKTLQDRGSGGFHFSAEEEGTVNGLKVRRLEITVDKLVDGERRLYGWEFAAPDAYFGLVAEILVQEEKRLKPEILQSFGTFRIFPRTGSLPHAGRTGEEIVVKGSGKDEEREISPEELKKERDDAAARALARIRENLGQGWNVVESKNFTAITHSDPKHTREVLAHAEALRAWLEEKFSYVGSGYAGRILIRIFANSQEHQSFLEARRWAPRSYEVTTFKDKEGWLDWHMESLNRSIAYIWLEDRNERLLWALPEWLRWGFMDFVERARSKGGKLEFKADTWDSVEMMNLRRSGDIFPPRTFFTTTSEALWNLPGISTQTQFFVHYLIAGGGSRHPKYRNILPDYVKGLIVLLDAEKPAAAGAAPEPQSEKEEADLVRARQNAWRAREQEILQKLLDRTFPGWTDKEWEAFRAAYRQELK